jgi:RHS repeat-associated protein
MSPPGGAGHSGTAAAPESGPRERSAPQSAATTPAPPKPIVAPTGSVPLDMLGHIINRAAEPWQDLPNQTPLQKVQTVVQGVMGVLNMDVLVDAFNAGVALATAPLNAIYPALPAATLMAPHIGTPHTHPHPPSIVPPAPPIPLPSIGSVMVGGCVSVLIGGLPAARAGDLGLALTCVSFSPPFEIYTGSSKVFIGGSRAARLGDITKHCGAASSGDFSMMGAGVTAAMGLLGAATAPSALAAGMAAAQTAVDIAKMAVAALMGKDPGAPPCIGSILMGSPTVLIGGIPLPPLENYARAFFMKLNKPLANALHSIIGKVFGKKSRAANFFHALTCHMTGHPVDVASGRMLTSAEELRLPGPIPFVWQRQYATSWSERNGRLGWGWSHSYDMAVWGETGRVVYQAEDGREIEFDLEPEARDRMPWLKTNERWDRWNHLILRELRNGTWEVESLDGLVRVFALIPGDRIRPGQARLVSIFDRFDHRMTFGYDPIGNLATIVDSTGRTIRVESDQAGRVARVLAPAPDAEAFVEYIRYDYSPEGDLVAAVDVLGHAMRMGYDRHLMVKETKRSGLSFHFAYEGRGNDARCIATWGDGGIYKRRLIYDTNNHTTIVTDSRGADTIYQMNADNAVVSITDALGAVTRYEFDDCYHKVAETDPLDRTSKWVFDERGNCTKIVHPDGSEVSLAYDERNAVIRAVDPIKGEWRWEYDRSGRLLARMDPLNRVSRFAWQSEAELMGQTGRVSASFSQAKRMVGFTDPAGGQTVLEYDRQGLLVGMRMPNGAQTRWRYDRLGRCIEVVDAKGNRERRQFDLAGRILRVELPDGNVRALSYDAEGNVLAVKDKHYDVNFTYQGMGRLASRTQEGTTVKFEYDSEEALVAIHNEAGAVYRFTLDKAGNVKEESGFDGLLRKYGRDKSGRVLKVERPDDRVTEYRYDAGGRVVGVDYSDGSSESYGYRADGALIEASNSTATVKFVRDALGRIVKEIQGDDSVESAFDLLGLRSRMKTSKGHGLEIERNLVGDVVGMKAGGGPVAPGGAPSAQAILPPWEARFTRDQLGLEIERTLPGGVRARWERDTVGRPLKHEIWSSATMVAAQAYTWEPNDRLKMIVDALQGPVQYRHDGLGNLIGATYPDGKLDLRMPDAVGNLFRTPNKTDRTYGPAGQLLQSEGPDGITQYEYDPEGNLAKKILPNGNEWTYEWNAAGMLAKVVRPDHKTVEFGYDALGRRVWKKYGTKTTKWMWDGNVPVHEWVEVDPGVAAPPAQQEAVASEAELLDRKRLLSRRSAQGPPPETSGTANAPITWVFEPESFSPLAKLTAAQRFGIVTDHLGTPTAMLDEQGKPAWSADIGVYGDLRNVVGERTACPFRWPGQYEDDETGLYYNRFRYYDPDVGGYVSQDPIGLKGGLCLTAYVRDPLIWRDPLGLSGCNDDNPEESTAIVPYYPPDDGFAHPPIPVTLPPGTRLDRYGGPHGRFVSPEGVPTPMRALPYDADMSQYRVYEVMKPLNVQSGEIAPAFGKLGGGVQHVLPRPASELVSEGTLREVSKP